MRERTVGVCEILIWDVNEDVAIAILHVHALQLTPIGEKRTAWPWIGFVEFRHATSSTTPELHVLLMPCRTFCMLHVRMSHHFEASHLHGRACEPPMS